MGWEHREGLPSIWHNHRMDKYAKKRYYVPDLVTRDEWGAEPPFEWYEPFQHPVKKVTLMYTDTDLCESFKSCSKIIRQLQREHIELGLTDIAYNYIIGGDGRKYEGRGWYVRAEKPLRKLKRKTKSFMIAYVGNGDDFRAKIPTIMFEAKDNLLTYGVTHNYLTCCYNLKKDVDDRNIFEKGLDHEGFL